MDHPQGAHSSYSPHEKMFGPGTIQNKLNTCDFLGGEYAMPNVDPISALFLHGDSWSQQAQGFSMENSQGSSGLVHLDQMIQSSGGDHNQNTQSALMHARVAQIRDGTCKQETSENHNYLPQSGVGMHMYQEQHVPTSELHQTGSHQYFMPSSDGSMSHSVNNNANFSQIQSGLERQQGYPLESPLITPASVFSTISSASTNDFLSPITSPALQPQPTRNRTLSSLDLDTMQRFPDLTLTSPHVLNDEKQESPISPLGGNERNRRSRSVAIESRAQKVRPSPLSKPMNPRNGNSCNYLPNAQASMQRKEGQPLRAGIPSPSLHTLESLSNTLNDAGEVNIQNTAISSKQHTKAMNFPRGVSYDGSGPSERGDEHAGQSADSPSPIDLETERGMHKPVTPATIMGFNGPLNGSPSAEQDTQHIVADKTAQAPAGTASNAVVSNTSSRPLMGENDIKHLPAQTTVNVATNVHAAQSHGSPYYMSPMVGMQQSRQHKSILPSVLSASDRNAWFNLRRASSGVDQRRTSHKAAEQKRRDSLKYCFDELRSLLPGIALDDNIPSGSALGPDGTPEDQLAEGFDPELLEKTKNEAGDEQLRPDQVVLSPDQAREANRTIAKVLLLRHSNEYLVRLKNRIERRDKVIEALSEEVVLLRNRLATLEPASKHNSSPKQVSTDGS